MVLSRKLVPLAVVLAVLAVIAAVSQLLPIPAYADTGTIATDDQLWVEQANPNTTTGHCTTWSSVNGSATAGKRIMVSFPTAGVVPTGQVVTAATLRVYPKANYSGNNLSVKAYTRTGAINCNVTWNNLGTVGSQVGISSGSFAKNTYKSITLDPASVNTAGRTAFVLDATAASLMEFKADSSVGGFNPSKLDLTYSTAATTTTVAPTTTTTPPTGACVSAHAVPEYGAADDIGPGREDRDTTGTQATTSNYITVLAAAQPGDEVLLRAGSYGSLNIPPGVSVKPYDCEQVTSGTFNLHDGSTVAGFTASASSAQYVDEIASTDQATIRNMRVRGGTGDGIRISGDSAGVTIIGSDVDGGQANHAILVGVTGQAAPYPSTIKITNSYVSKVFYAGSLGEDGVQWQASQGTANEVANLSFGKVGEEFIDVKKPSTVTIHHNDLDNDGPADNVNLTPGGGCALLTSDAAPVFQHNRLWGGQGGCVLEIGGYQSDGIWANAVITDNQVTDTEVLLRGSDGVQYTGNAHTRGILGLGTSNDATDRPKNLTISGNAFVGPGTVKVNSGSTYTCDGNTWTGTWAQEGTLTCTNQPVP